MNIEYYIAKRLIKGEDNASNYSRPIIKTAVIGIAIGIVVMIVAVSVLAGFKQGISQKVIGFASHLQVENFDNNVSYESLPINKNQQWLEAAKEIPEITNIQKFITTAGIIQTNDYLHGVVLKGIDSDFSWDFFSEYIQIGDTLTIVDSVKSNNIIISKNIANKLKLELGDKVRMFFIKENPRMRAFTVSGIYDTQLEEFDKVYTFCDIKHLQKLNNWSADQISGFEVKIDDLDNLIDVDRKLTRLISSNFSPDQEVLSVDNIYQKNPHIFDWLDLQDKNTYVILILMVLVAGFNMISGLLIIILERTNMIGILKSLGSPNVSIQKIFLYHATILISKGLLWGNIIGLGICLLQQYFGIIQLNSDLYYLSTVPIKLSVLPVVLINIGTVIITVCMLILPSMLVTRISPSQAIQFD